MNAAFSFRRIKKRGADDVEHDFLSRRIGSAPWFKPVATVDASAQLLVDSMASRMAAPTSVSIAGSATYHEAPTPWMAVDPNP